MDLDLKPGEVICDKCDGSGIIQTTDKKFFIHKRQCDQCKGDGKLDWIENVVGKEETESDVMDDVLRYFEFNKWSMSHPTGRIKNSHDNIKNSMNPHYLKHIQKNSRKFVTKIKKGGCV